MLSEAARQSLRAGLIENSKVVTQMLVDIDVEEAKAMVPEDHEQLSVRLLHTTHATHQTCLVSLLTQSAVFAGSVPRDGGRLPPRQR